VICSNCGTQNPVGAKFCKRCGAGLAASCPSCGAPCEPDATFCNECGTRLQGSVARAPTKIPVDSSPAQAAPVAERRLVSVLFLDLVGFTSLAEGRDAEETRDLLTRYFDLARDTIERYGGTVEKFIGDAVMAVWGAPTAQEDDAERAVRTALDLVDGVRTLAPGIQARAAVLTGEAAVTLGATGQGMVAGDLVNTASRLQSVAPAGAVLVGEATHRASSAAIVFEEAGEQLLKGKTAPVSAWRALRVVAERGGRRRSDLLEAPFVGRDDELRLLKDLYHATSRERRARLVSVTGPAGIGKSRLAWELLKYIDGLAEEIWWHEGRCAAYGDGVTFWALGEMVRRRAGLAETDDERTTRERVAATVAEHVPDEAEQRWVEQALLALLGLEPPPPGGSDELFAAWRTFFERMAATGPVCMVFEDLQWADTGLLDFIDHLLEWSKNVPVYVLALARPELFELRPGWGSGKRSFAAVAVEPLSEPAMRQLLAGLVPGLPGAAVRRIVDRAGGVPLYAIETVRMLVETGQLVTDGTTFRPIGDLSSLAVPETLHALVASRLDALDPAERSLVQDAAVLGQSFTIAGLGAVSGIEAAALEPRLRSLVRRELLALEADPRSPERGQYSFVQALAREVAYSTLAKPDRRRRHLAAARHFEALGDEELAGALAAQYLAAYRNSSEGPEADALAAQARVTLRGAAARAAALGSHEQALTFLEQALGTTEDPGEQAGLLDRAGYSASHAGHHDRGESLYRRAIEIYAAMGDRRSAARATAALAAALIDTFRMAPALALLEPAVDEYADLVDDPVGISLASQLARVLTLNGQHHRSVELADRVLGIAERQDLVPVIAESLVTKGTALASLGRGYEAIGELQAGRQLAETRGLTDTALRALINLGVTLGDRDPRAAFEASCAALEQARRVGDRGAALFVLANAVEEAAPVGEWDWALAELADALSTDLDASNRAIFLMDRAPLLAFRGEGGDEELAEAEALALGSGIEYADVVADFLFVRGQVALAAGRLQDAYEHAMTDVHASAMTAPRNISFAGRPALWARDADRARAAVDALDATGVHGRGVELSRLTIRAGIAALEGRPAEALSGYREALRGWQDLGVPWFQALTAVDALTLLGPGEPELQAAGEEARAILTRLGAKPILARLEAAMQPASQASAAVVSSP
jgi:class 3 adenylate cyclase/predicted ATPase